MHNIQCNICIGLGSSPPFTQNLNYKIHTHTYIYYTKYDIIIIYHKNYLV